MESRPAGVAPEEQAAVFTAASQRMTRAFLLAQVEEAERFGVGDCLWANQVRDCVERIESHLAVHPQAFPTDRVLRLVE